MHDDGMTTSSHTGDTAGGGRGYLLDQDGDVPMSILQKRHTASTDSVKYENEMTTISRTRDTAGGGCDALSSAHSDDEHLATEAHEQCTPQR